MAYEVVSYPLVPGIRQDSDRTLLPPGTLVEASGARRRKNGLARANGFVDAGVVPADGTMEHPCDALGAATGRQVAVMNGRAWARGGFGDQWVEVGRASRARPVKAHWAAFTDATSGVIHAATARIGDYIATAHYDGSGVRVVVMDPAGLRRAAGSFASRSRPRIFAVGSTFVLTMMDIATGDIYGATIDGTTLAISSETFIIAQVNSSDVYDAAPFNSTNWLLAHRSGATTFQVVFGDTSLGLGAFQSVTIAANNITACCVYGTDGEGIWATYVQQTAAEQRICAFAEDLSSTTLTNLQLTSSASATPAVMTRRDATSVWVAFEEISSSPTRYLLRVRAYTQVSFDVTSEAYAWHLRIASRPWGGSSSSMSMWVHTDGGAAAWRVQRRYTLVTLAMDQLVPLSYGMFVEPELSPDERANEQQSFHPPECVFHDERGYFPALATIRTQNDESPGTAALVLYEWESNEDTDARMRQVAEVGGLGVVFGGGLQELPSARIHPSGLNTIPRGSENGFLFAPAILSATPTATGSDGLTLGALYQFYATFEYVTADGLRVRSAPSNKIEATPTAGNLNIQLKISSSPTSEREYSAPPNATVCHVYATTGGGSTFQRVTPDSGLTAAISTTASGVLTFTHSAADDDVLDNEALYTEKGEQANQPAPAHRFGWTGGGYAWVAGLFNPQLIERSKIGAVNEPVQFTRLRASRCLIPENVTGGAWMDGVSVVFSLTSIYLVSASLGAPQRHPSPVGCIDYRSVVETPDGIGFQSRRGYEILPRGFGQTALISAPIDDELRGRTVISATVTGHAGSEYADAPRFGEHLLVLFAIDPALAGDAGVRLVYDLDARLWLSADDAMGLAVDGEVLTSWDGRLVAASRSALVSGDAFIRYEDPTDWGSVENRPMSIKLADLRPFDILRRGQISRVILLGEIRSTADITLTVYEDGAYSRPLRFQKPTQSAIGTAGDKFMLSWQLPTRQLNALTLKLDCASDGEGAILHAIGIEADGLPGRPRISQERQAA